VVAAQSRKTALSVGLSDRGLIATGYKADLNVIDYDKLHLHAPKVHYDLPVGGRRLLQQVDGYDATIVSGVITRREGGATGQRPGKLIRGAQGELREFGAAAG
jgi:N-acyl-D-aspartate/D-glutamate deacylase